MTTLMLLAKTERMIVRIINTSKPLALNSLEEQWVYNGMDCCVTAELLNVLLPQLDPTTSATYTFSRALQGPVFDMRIRGMLVDQERRKVVLNEFADMVDQCEATLERIVRDGTGFHGFSWRSWQSLHKLFYDIYRIPPIKTKEGKRTANRDALEKLESYRLARPVVRFMEILRELDKKMDVLMMELDDDGRIRTSYNIAGTNTGRFSSSFTEFDTGGNLQNIEESLRSVFIADPGMKLANFDAEQGESRVVGAIEWNLFRRGAYLDACESGDLHTAVARICWPNLGWTSTLEVDREIAEHPYYRHYSRRFMCKKLGHGTNYGGRPQTMSTQTKTDITIIVDFQEKYFTAFPAHQMWHNWVNEQIRSYGRLTSLMQRRRYFFGRRDNDDTIREAIAYDPQSSLADIVNRGMLGVWKSGVCQLLLQNHDSIVVQYPEEQEDEIIPKIRALLHHEIPLKHDRTLTIPYGCKTGWNWGEFSESNPDGLKSYNSSDKRTRATRL
jgi:DNA polymerase I